MAIWQALNKDAWWKSFEVRNDQGKVIKTVTPHDDLMPFRRNEKGEYHNADTSRYTTEFGYVYPETQEWKYESDEEYEAAIRTALDALYGTAPAQDQLAIGHADIVINVAFPR
jgi:tyrosinase